MKALKPARGQRGVAEPPNTPSGARLLNLDARRIERALAQRSRYKYVQPRVERAGLGWQVLSPNCSRNIDPQGGEIAIAWLVPAADASWCLYSRHHAQDCWQLRQQGPLPALLQRLGSDPDREFWV